MPSGAYVTVELYMQRSFYNRNGTYLNINVHPLRVDAYQTTGLCGDYDLNDTNDGPADPASDLCSSECNTHRQELFVTLFIKCKSYSLSRIEFLTAT